MVDIPKTYGALLLGGLVAFFLSGIVTLQSFFYYKFYPSDIPRIKIIVAAVWFVDLIHTAFIAILLWQYFIVFFGNDSKINFIPWCLPMTIALTASLTFLVHCFFAHRIYRVSKQKWQLTIPVVLFAVLRFGIGGLSTGQMLRIESLSGFVTHFGWAFTLGLALSSIVDILIACILCYYLLQGRKQSPRMHHVIDSLILYTFETGALTCSATIISMLCWVAMPHNLIYVGLYFVVSKLYANSLLATLNARKSVRNDKPPSMITLPVPASLGRHQMIPLSNLQAQRFFSPTRSVSVEQTIEYKVDGQSSAHKRTPSTVYSAITSMAAKAL